MTPPIKHYSRRQGVSGRKSITLPIGLLQENWGRNVRPTPRSSPPMRPVAPSVAGRTGETPSTSSPYTRKNKSRPCCTTMQEHSTSMRKWMGNCVWWTTRQGSGSTKKVFSRTVRIGWPFTNRDTRQTEAGLSVCRRMPTIRHLKP